MRKGEASSGAKMKTKSMDARERRGREKGEGGREGGRVK